MHPKFEEHLQILDEELTASDHVISSLLDMTRVRKMERIRVELEPMLEEVKSRCRIRPPVDLRVDLAPKPFSLCPIPYNCAKYLLT